MVIRLSPVLCTMLWVIWEGSLGWALRSCHSKYPGSQILLGSPSWALVTVFILLASLGLEKLYIYTHVTCFYIGVYKKWRWHTALHMYNLLHYSVELCQEKSGVKLHRCNQLCGLPIAYPRVAISSRQRGYSLVLCQLATNIVIGTSYILV